MYLYVLVYIICILYQVLQVYLSRHTLQRYNDDCADDHVVQVKQGHLVI